MARKGQELAESIETDEEEARERVASALVCLGDYRRAYPLYKTLVVEFEHIEEEVGAMTRRCLFNLTTIYVAVGILNRAQDCVERAMATRKAFESDPLDVANALQDYGTFLRGAQFLQEAHAVACECLELSASLPEDDELHGLAALELGEAEFGLCRLEEAKAHFKKALRLVIVARGERHQYTARAKYCLGLCTWHVAGPAKLFLSSGTVPTLWRK